MFETKGVKYKCKLKELFPKTLFHLIYLSDISAIAFGISQGPVVQVVEGGTEPTLTMQ